LHLSKLEIFVLSVAIMVVFLAEVINTLIEDLSNLITEEFHPKIKLIKDVAAGVVLVAVLFAGILGFFVFHIAGFLIHLLIIVAVIMVLIRVIKGENPFK